MGSARGVSAWGQRGVSVRAAWGPCATTSTDLPGKSSTKSAQKKNN